MAFICGQPRSSDGGVIGLVLAFITAYFVKGGRYVLEANLGSRDFEHAMTHKHSWR